MTVFIPKIAGTDLGRFIQAKSYRIHTQRPYPIQGGLMVDAANHYPVLFQTRHDRNLLDADPFNILEPFQMTRPDLRDHRNVRLSYPRQWSNLTGGVARDFHHRKFVVRLNTQNG